jgi:hypothetical protein
MAKIIEFFVPNNFRKKGKVGAPGRIWEGDSVQRAAKEISLTVS